MGIFVTDDLYLRRDGVRDPVDEQTVPAGYRCVSTLEFMEMLPDLPEDDRPEDLPPGLLDLTPESFKALNKRGIQTFGEFSIYAQRFVSRSRARTVRELRCDLRYSWRALAAECHRRWDGAWDPPSNQLMGMALCERAAQILGEDAHELPWNDT